ncbi:MAG: class I SAM-dependent RNA methyltransferase [Clostridiales bacterium]|jgi:putative N6-adenine-specific DNA methylase|nr:class I SAM-dependent RNA methyltransferase [Clostridiales bacterium]
MLCLATCKLGLESVVAGELRALSINLESVRDARVFFHADADALFKALLFLRAAERVLVVVKTFEARTFDELFEGVKAIPWREYLLRDSFIHVNGKSARSALFSVSDCQRIVKKAIVESLRGAYHTTLLPETGKEIIVEVGMLRDTATIALDACGAGLARRGYRICNVAAPLSETLGAGLVLLSRYRGDRPFLDPMCGSGTIPIEAAMIAKNIAPGFGRGFAAEDWHFIPATRAAIRAREEARDGIRNIPLDIAGSDSDARSVALCKKHAKRAGVMIRWAVRPLADLSAQPSGGILVTNPPYGDRMMDERAVKALYHDMRGVFAGLHDWSVHIISACREFERAYGLRAHKRRKLTSGGKPCVFYQYFPARQKKP